MNVLTDDLRDAIRALFPRYPTRQAVTLPALHMVHDRYGCVSTDAIEEIAAILELAPAQVHDTLSFYGYFRSEENPSGRKRIWICRSLPCMLRGGEDLLVEMCQRLNLNPGETSEDGRVTIELAECLGACDGAPCILIEDELELNVTPERIEQIIDQGVPS